MKKIFLLLLVCCICKPVLSQTFLIRYQFISTHDISDSTIPVLMRPFQDQGLGVPRDFPVISETYSKRGNVCTNSILYQVTDTSCAYIGDGFGHEIIVIPGDTLNVALSVIPQNEWGKLNGKFHSSWMLNLVFSGRDMYIHSLLDSLAYNTGIINIEFTSLTSVNNDIAKFYTVITQHYNDRKKYLKEYCLRYNIPANIEELVSAEIKCAHLLDLIRGYDKNDSYPAAYLKEIENLVFDNENFFFKTAMYHGVASSYIKFIQNEFDEQFPFSASRFLNNYSSIKTTYSGKIRDYLLAGHLDDFVPEKMKNFDSVLADFKTICTDSIYYHFIDSVYKRTLYDRGITLKQAMNSYLTGVNGKKIKFSTVFKGRPVLVDCWASWCGPCIAQIPFTEELEKQYKGKIDFVYLSFDKKKDAWLAKINSLGLEGMQYQADKNFRSNFAAYFEIGSIPRYLLFDRKGKIITSNAPRPSKKEQLIKLLDKALK